MTSAMTQNPHLGLEMARAYQRDRFEDAQRRRQATSAPASRTGQRRARPLRVFRGHRATTVATA